MLMITRCQSLIRSRQIAVALVDEVYRLECLIRRNFEILISLRKLWQVYGDNDPQTSLLVCKTDSELSVIYEEVEEVSDINEVQLYE